MGELESYRHFVAKVKKVLMVLPIALLTGINRLIIKFVPFKTIGEFLGQYMVLSNVTVSEKKLRQAKVIAKLLRYITQITPWRVMCFEQALTAAQLYKVLGIPFDIFFGTKRMTDGSLCAHSWISVGGQVMTGGEEMADFKVLANYGWRPDKI